MTLLAACKMLTSGYMTILRQAMSPNSRDGWTAAEFRTLARAIAESELGCITQDELNDLDISADAQEALQQSKLMLFRPFDVTPKDFPLEAYGTEEGSIVTFASVAQLTCARRLLAAGKLFR